MLAYSSVDGMCTGLGFVSSSSRDLSQMLEAITAEKKKLAKMLMDYDTAISGVSKKLDGNAVKILDKKFPFLAVDIDTHNRKILVKALNMPHILKYEGHIVYSTLPLYDYQALISPDRDIVFGSLCHFRSIEEENKLLPYAVAGKALSYIGVHPHASEVVRRHSIGIDSFVFAPFDGVCQGNNRLVSFLHGMSDTDDVPIFLGNLATWFHEVTFMDMYRGNCAQPVYYKEDPTVFAPMVEAAYMLRKKLPVPPENNVKWGEYLSDSLVPACKEVVSGGDSMFAKAVSREVQLMGEAIRFWQHQTNLVRLVNACFLMESRFGERPIMQQMVMHDLLELDCPGVDTLCFAEDELCRKENIEALRYWLSN